MNVNLKLQRQGKGMNLRALSFINPRRACAARVTVVVLCVSLSVCVSVFTVKGCSGRIQTSDVYTLTRQMLYQLSY